jgi:virginiamycin B lyase
MRRLAIVLGLAASLCVSTAHAASIETVAVPGVHDISAIAVAPDGTIWLATYPNIVAFANGAVRYYDVSNPKPNLTSAILDPGGTLWFSDCWGESYGTITPAGQVTVQVEGVDRCITDMTLDATGVVWFTDNRGGVGRFQPSIWVNGLMLPVGQTSAGPGIPSGPVAAPDGSVWVGYRDARYNSIVERVWPQPDAQYRVPSVSEADLNGATPQQIGQMAAVAGAVWWAGNDAGVVGRVLPDGKVTLFPTGLPRVNEVGAGSDGNLWFVGGDCATSRNYLGRLTPSGKVTLFNAPRDMGSRGARPVSGPDGSLWFSGYDKLYRLDPKSPPPSVAAPPKPTGRLRLHRDGDYLYAYAKVSASACGNYTVIVHKIGGHSSISHSLLANIAGGNIVATVPRSRGTYKISLRVAGRVLDQITARVH